MRQGGSTIITAITQRPNSLLVASGVIGHLVFNRLEPRSLTSYLVLLLVVPALLSVSLRESYDSSIGVFLSASLYHASLVLSLLLYRLSPFHPLYRYPGPLLCKISRFWAFYIASQGQQHRYYHALHERYGTHVRTGPNHLHVRDASAVPLVLGPKGFHKGGRYNVFRLPGSKGSLLNLTAPHEHAQRRRLWEKALSASAIKGYHGFLTRRVNQLLDGLESDKGTVDLSQWLSFFSFDFVGDLSFGSSFNLLQMGADPENYLLQSKLNVRKIELAGSIPWVRPFLAMFMKARGITGLNLFAKTCVMARKAAGSNFRDLFHYLLDEDGSDAEPLSTGTLVADAGLLITAGSDTTGTALSNLFFYLISHPSVYDRLRAEIDEAVPSGTSGLDTGVLAELPYLNAVMLSDFSLDQRYRVINSRITRNETLRLQPGVPNGMQRVPPPRSRGTLIAGRWVPPSTTVQTSVYSVHRDPRYFSPHPDSFWPERWIASEQENTPDYTLNRVAFFPFSYGPDSCVGKPLALVEMRMATAALVRNLVFDFAPRWDPSTWTKELSDNYILTKGSLPVLVSQRKLTDNRFDSA